MHAHVAGVRSERDAPCLTPFPNDARCCPSSPQPSGVQARSTVPGSAIAPASRGQAPGVAEASFRSGIGSPFLLGPSRHFLRITSLHVMNRARTGAPLGRANTARQTRHANTLDRSTCPQVWRPCLASRCIMLPALGWRPYNSIKSCHL